MFGALDELGYDHLWAWDHLYAIFGDPYQPIFEGWSSLVAAAGTTKRIRLGLLVGANTFRNPGLSAKLATTLDHVSNGRAILGVGGAWMEPEHTAHGIEFGSGFGQRLDWLDEVGRRRCATLLDGKSVTSPPGGHYAFEDLRQHPLPVQKHLPIMIGGSGEKKTLRTVAKYADIWNGMGPLDFMRHKVEVLRAALRGRRPRSLGDRVHPGHQGDDPRLRGGGRPRLESRDGAQPDAAGEPRGRLDVLERHGRAAGREARAVRRARLPHGDLRAARAV